MQGFDQSPLIVISPDNIQKGSFDYDNDGKQFHRVNTLDE